MAFERREIKDQIVEFPNRYKIDGVPKTIEPDFGAITEPGTPINKEFLQRYEDRLSEVVSSRVTADKRHYITEDIPFGKYIQTRSAQAVTVKSYASSAKAALLSSDGHIVVATFTTATNIECTVFDAKGSQRATTTISFTGYNFDGDKRRQAVVVLRENVVLVFCSLNYSPPSVDGYCLLEFDPASNTLVTLSTSANIQAPMSGGYTDGYQHVGNIMSANKKYIAMFYISNYSSTTLLRYLVLDCSSPVMARLSDASVISQSGDYYYSLYAALTRYSNLKASDAYGKALLLADSPSSGFATSYGARAVSISDAGIVTIGSISTALYTKGTLSTSALYSMDIGEQILWIYQGNLLKILDKFANTVTVKREIELPISAGTLIGFNCATRTIYTSSKYEMQLEGYGDNMLVSAAREVLETAPGLHHIPDVKNVFSATNYAIKPIVAAGELEVIPSTHASATGIAGKDMKKGFDYPHLFY